MTRQKIKILHQQNSKIFTLKKQQPSMENPLMILIINFNGSPLSTQFSYQQDNQLQYILLYIQIIIKYKNHFQNLAMQFLICQKHNKTQKASHKVTTNSYVCMNRYCQNSFNTLCVLCKNDHRDHSNKILTVEDITFLIERLLKSPLKQLTSYIDQAVSAMKKFKLIQENKRKIQILEKQIYKQVLGLVDYTESLIHQYAVCKKTVTQLSDLLVNIQTPQVFTQFRNTSRQFLSNLQYNFQKDKLQYGNQLIRQKYDNRRKSYQKTKRKLQQVKDYSMKIIEVILANEQSDQEQEDIIYKKKMYQILKRQLQEGSQKQIKQQKEEGQKQTNSNNISIQQQIFENGNQSMMSEDKKSKATTTPGVLSSKSQSILSIQKSCQTSSQWLKTIQDSTKQYELKIQKLKLANAKSQNELKNKISSLVKQKQAIKRQFSQLQQRQKQKNDKILQIENKLRQNKKKRQLKQRQKQNKFQKLIEIANWKHIIQGDRID